ncbi:MAG: thiamine phosphate synthase, partial [Chloroflexi bacterium]|nr:thiamine phosphate synthase [Chloroflexota bacterium]
MRRPILCLVAGGPVASGVSLPDAVDAAVRGGVNLVQLREKQMAAGELLVLAREIRKICRSRGALFYV